MARETTAAAPAAITTTGHDLETLAYHLSVIYRESGRVGFAAPDGRHCEITITAGTLSADTNDPIWDQVTIDGHWCGNRHGGAKAYVRFWAGKAEYGARRKRVPSRAASRPAVGARFARAAGAGRLTEGQRIMFEDTRRIARKPTRRQLATQEIDWRTVWEQKKAAFVTEAWRTYMQSGGACRLYGYYTPSAGETWGQLYVLGEMDAVPEGAELITAEAIPAGDTMTIARWLEAYAQRLPVLPTAGAYAHVRRTGR